MFAFVASGVIVASALGAAVTYGSLGEVVVLLAMLPLGVAITLRSPRGTIISLAVWLAALGTTRRLFPQTASTSSALGDALLLVGPIIFGLLFITAAGKGSLTNRSALAKPVYWLTALAAAEVVNPLQHSLAVGIGGGLFLVTPMLAFWVGRAILDGKTMRRLLTVVAWMAIAAAAYGLLQTYAGFPSWDRRWIQTKGYTALHVAGTIRAFSSFASAQEYATFVAVGIAIWVARARTPANTILSLSVVSFLGVALLLESSRAILVYAVVAIGVMVAARSGVSLFGAAAGGGLTLAVLLVIVDHFAGGGGSAAVVANGNTTQQLIGHQLSGLAHPFDNKSSSLDGHFGRLVRGVGEAFTMPIGHGTGSVTNAAGVFGTASLGTEVDPSNAAVAFGLPGLVLYLMILVRGLSTAFRVASRDQDWISIAVIGILVVTLMQWLSGNLYSTVWLPWLCLGWTDRLTGAETLAAHDRAGLEIDALNYPL
jgi:hypothetical protein